MRILQNQSRVEVRINHIRKQFPERSGIHMSQLNGCLRKSYWRIVEPATGLEEHNTIIAFGIGAALQHWLQFADWVKKYDAMRLTEDNYWAAHKNFLPVLEQTLVVDGISLSPDWLNEETGPVEIKTTSAQPEPTKSMKAEGITTPEERILNNHAWMRQCMAYCYAINEAELRGVDPPEEYYWGLDVVHLTPGNRELRCYDLWFSREELIANWDWFKERKSILAEALDIGEPPSVFYAEEWEHNLCPFYLRCESELRRR